MDAESGTRTPRWVAATSRRGLVAAGAGWALSAAGLLLPAADDEAEARTGADGGTLGGRRGKNHRGENTNQRQHRRKHHAGHHDTPVHHHSVLTKDIYVAIFNQSASPITVRYESGANQRSNSIGPGGENDFAGGASTLTAYITTPLGCVDPNAMFCPQDWTFRLYVENPLIDRPAVSVNTYGSTRLADPPLARTYMSVGDRIDVPQYGFWVQRNADFDYKAIAFGLY
jgi:hypothetical protein